MYSTGISYKSGYKYQLVEDFIYQLGPEFPDVVEHETQFLWINDDKLLIIKKGYAWDGPSGPTIDTKNFMRGSLVHDSAYQLIREGFFNKNQCRHLADLLLYKIIREDGMSWLRANVVYYAVRVFGNPSARRSGEPLVITAP